MQKISNETVDYASALVKLNSRAKNAEQEKADLEDYYKGQLKIAKDLIIENYRQSIALKQLRRKYVKILRKWEKAEEKIKDLTEWKKKKITKIMEKIRRNNAG